jgi:protein-tyrosine sulfotransferase
MDETFETRHTGGSLDDLHGNRQAPGLLEGSQAGSSCDPPIFILGSVRSGTTLLRYILDTHPSICCPPESKFIAGVEAFIKAPQVLAGLSSMGFTQRDIKRELKQLVSRFFELYAQRSKKRRWADKTPSYYKRLWLIEELFDRQPLYVLLVRHPLDSISSLEENVGVDDPDVGVGEMINRYGTGRYAWAKYWLEVNYVLMAFASGAPERAKIITYEGLVSQTVPTVRDLFAFLGEALPEDLISKVFTTRRYKGFGDHKIATTSRIHTDSVGRWRTWKKPEIDAIWEIVQPLATRLGYSVDNQLEGRESRCDSPKVDPAWKR